ncbi:hypothetical protein NYE40_05235 [Paenibacillus sp. FSL W8-1187]|uniref:hypothetical protein n=1 Tax=Paenibacillus sp. FSL W8-1187 TaxID=2975339 RepID=UPI0030D6D886
MQLTYTISVDQVVVNDDKDNRFKVFQIEDCNLGKLQGTLIRYQSLLASEHDLIYSRAYIDQMFYTVDSTLIDGALINSAIQLLVKCFSNPGGKGRSQIDAKQVFDSFAKSIGKNSYLKQFNDLRDIRNRTLAHDEGDFRDSKVGITVDVYTQKPVEIAQVYMRRKFLYKENAVILRDMITIAVEYISDQKQKIEKIMMDHYGTKSFSEISQYKLLDCKGADTYNVW